MNFSDEINSLLLDYFSGAASFRPFPPCTGGTTTCPGTTPAAPTCSWWPAGPAPDAPRRPLWWPARPPSSAQSGRRRWLAALLCQRRRRHTASCCQITARSRRPTRSWIYAAKFRRKGRPTLIWASTLQKWVLRSHWVLFWSWFWRPSPACPMAKGGGHL